MKKNELRELEKSCDICTYAFKVETTGKILCTKGKSLKETDPSKPCRKFKLDLLSYKPMPTKLPDFVVPEDSGLL